MPLRDPRVLKSRLKSALFISMTQPYRQASSIYQLKVVRAWLSRTVIDDRRSLNCQLWIWNNGILINNLGSTVLDLHAQTVDTSIDFCFLHASKKEGAIIFKLGVTVNIMH